MDTVEIKDAFKKASLIDAPLCNTLTSTRYTSSRIRRIALQNLLNIDESLTRESLQSPLYLRVLAIKKERAEVLSAISESAFPLLIRAHDEEKLSGIAKECFETDIYAEKIYGLLYPQNRTEKNVFV